MKKNYLYKIVLIIGLMGYSLNSIAQPLLNNSQFYHTFSGTSFPNMIGKYTYTWPQQYDDLGKDISVGYKIDTKVAISQYIYPSQGQDITKHFDDYNNSLLENKNNSKLLSSDKILTMGLAGRVSKLQYMEDFFGKTQLVYSYVYMYESKGWFIMIRCTSQIVDNIEIEKEISDYVSKMPFPTIKYK